MTTALVVLLGVAVAVLAVLVGGLLRSHAIILRRLEDMGAGIGSDAAIGEGSTAAERQAVELQERRVPATAPIGRDAADVVGVDLQGGAVALRVVGAKHGTVLAFLSSTCLTCANYWDQLRTGSGVHLPAGDRLVIVTKGADEESVRALTDLAPKGVTTVLSSEAWIDYDVPGSPYVVYVDGPSGRVVGEGTGGSWDQVARLLADATGDLTFTTGPDARRRRKPRADADREADMDRALLRAGLTPDDARMYEPLQGDS